MVAYFSVEDSANYWLAQSKNKCGLSQIKNGALLQSASNTPPPQWTVVCYFTLESLIWFVKATLNINQPYCTVLYMYCTYCTVLYCMHTYFSLPFFLLLPTARISKWEFHLLSLKNEDCMHTGTAQFTVHLLTENRTTTRYWYETEACRKKHNITLFGVQYAYYRNLFAFKCFPFVGSILRIRQCKKPRKLF